MVDVPNLELYKFMHSQGHFAGHSLLVHIDEIKDLIEETGSRSMLDYGCGKALHHDGAAWGIPVYLYDPAVPMFALPPKGTFDMVICTDVLEHLPADRMFDIVGEIFSYADKHVFLTVCTRPAKKVLPDGRNAHLTVRDEEWWRAVIGERQVPYTLVFTK